MIVDRIIRNAQLVTCASNGKPLKGGAMGDAGVIADGAVAVENGLIVAVGRSADILSRFETENEIDAGGNVVSPGFVECHTHIIFAGDRLNEFELKIKGADYLEILEAGGGILSTVRQTRAAEKPDLVDATRRRLDKMLALGVTTCEIKTGYGLDTETEFKMMEVWAELDSTHAIYLVPTFLAAHAIPKADFRIGDPDLSDAEIGERYTSLICLEMIPKLVEWRDQYAGGSIEKLAKPFFVDVFCERNAFDREQTKRILETAKASHFGIKAHVDEFTNLGGSRLCIELGATSIDHLDAISDPEIALLAASGTIGVVTPTVNFNFGSHEFAPARKLIDGGCAIALSTDYNPGSAPCPSLANAMAIGCRYQKILPAEAFTAATVNAAFAVGLGDRTGSLEPGKWADLLIFETKDYREVAYEFGGNLIASVYKRGKRVR
ncbi:MAG: imidazolonepropionase [Acidobacteria bacterium]|nr:imidazolonepropionase [Acidobacteriota bacterium]MBK8149260.1 imidazolonepropionase [Acidobacteriota bacterium]MBK8811187.1 imidazolonepropionase [Acidobacteriota bacterium]